MSFTFSHPYTIAPEYAKPVAYFCMEYAIHQPLKIYAGGLGFLAGSHLRSAYALKQNLVAVGMLWKYGYYDQERKNDQTMDVLFQEKVYKFLQDTGIKFTVPINGADVWVTAWYLAPEVFETAPLFLLSTDLPENDYISRTITHRLYDSNPETGIAAAIVLGIGGARLFTFLNWQPEVYHLNESAGLPLAFYLYSSCHSAQGVRKQLVFTNHTAEAAGNRKTGISLLEKMGFFNGVPMPEVLAIAAVQQELLDYTLTALRLAGIANAVSALHLQTLRALWGSYPGICPLIAITNGQHFTYWADKAMYHALDAEDDQALRARKLACKEMLFEYVADQNGEILKKNIATLVFAKRFTGYKRPDLLLNNMERFERLISNKNFPVQVIWAGKPYPMDYTGIGMFDKIVHLCKQYANCSILTGYELTLSRLLKAGADIWLNTPRLTHEACGTSGMSAAMNGAVNLTIADGWVPEFATDRFNSFVIPTAAQQLSTEKQDAEEAGNLYHLLEQVVLPMYYQAPGEWLQLVKNSMLGIIPQFDSNRMAAGYYRQMYLYTPAG